MALSQALSSSGPAGLAGAEGEASGHVELDFAVGSDVRPEQWGESTEIFGGENAGPFGFGEDVLDHERVDVDQGGLEEVQGELCAGSWFPRNQKAAAWRWLLTRQRGSPARPYAFRGRHRPLRSRGHPAAGHDTHDHRDR